MPLPLPSASVRSLLVSPLLFFFLFFFFGRTFVKSRRADRTSRHCTAPLPRDTDTRRDDECATALTVHCIVECVSIVTVALRRRPLLFAWPSRAAAPLRSTRTTAPPLHCTALQHSRIRQRTANRTLALAARAASADTAPRCPSAFVSDREDSGSSAQRQRSTPPCSPLGRNQKKIRREKEEKRAR